MKDLIKAIDNDQQKLITTNEVGFYINSHMGLCFNREVITLLLESYKRFKNSVFIVYDTSKANYGLNPLHAYRLSLKAIDCFKQEMGVLQPTITQAKILEQKLLTQEIFEEVPIKVSRSHMQQAYLFDYIQPEMPAFNTNLFKLASPAYFESHIHTVAEMTENFNQSELQKQDSVLKAYQKLKLGKIKESSFLKTQAKAVEDDQNSDKLDFLMLSRQVAALCDQVEDYGIKEEAKEK